MKKNLWFAFSGNETVKISSVGVGPSNKWNRGSTSHGSSTTRLNRRIFFQFLNRRSTQNGDAYWYSLHIFPLINQTKVLSRSMTTVLQWLFGWLEEPGPSWLHTTREDRVILRHPIYTESDEYHQPHIFSGSSTNRDQISYVIKRSSSSFRNATGSSDLMRWLTKERPKSKRRMGTPQFLRWWSNFLMIWWSSLRRRLMFL